MTSEDVLLLSRHPAVLIQMNFIHQQVVIMTLNDLVFHLICTIDEIMTMLASAALLRRGNRFKFHINVTLTHFSNFGPWMIAKDHRTTTSSLIDDWDDLINPRARLTLYLIPSLFQRAVMTVYPVLAGSYTPDRGRDCCWELLVRKPTLDFSFTAGPYPCSVPLFSTLRLRPKRITTVFSAPALEFPVQGSTSYPLPWAIRVVQYVQKVRNGDIKVSQPGAAQECANLRSLSTLPCPGPELTVLANTTGSSTTISPAADEAALSAPPPLPSEPLPVASPEPLLFATDRSQRTPKQSQSPSFNQSRTGCRCIQARQFCSNRFESPGWVLEADKGGAKIFGRWGGTAARCGDDWSCWAYWILVAFVKGGMSVSVTGADD
ncbi:unnamed protein product [Rhizoctonia solani]|uniref:Uncharacterized protein n=1 Tax=Rhizoctonia solani TaxID=456999 RepID=A0A8H3GJK6_9AGAM|nr:unnamed protein product [Rhizoctonia solani]